MLEIFGLADDIFSKYSLPAQYLVPLDIPDKGMVSSDKILE